MKGSSVSIFRKIHKYFGLIIGVQFLFWTIGGIFFSWSNINQIHSDPYKSSQNGFDNLITLSSPQKIIDQLNKKRDHYNIHKLELLNIEGSPAYRIEISDKPEGRSEYFLADGATGLIRPPLTKEESVRLAIAAFKPDAPVKEVYHLTEGEAGEHHEYRKRILPAYAVSFDHPSGVTIYVSPEMAQIVTYRNSNWRIFDFLWMMHTMDYSGRDNFGNWLLRIMAVLGLITIVSGFLLFFISRTRDK